MSEASSQTILILSGERSGDQLARTLMRDIRASIPTAHFMGMGSQALADEGLELLVDNKKLAIMGFVEVLLKAKDICAAWKKLKKALDRKPKLVILIDYPGFNLRFAQLAKKRGIPVLYYVSPQIWAWKAGRMKTIQRCVDHMALLFPFEAEIYRDAGVPYTVVGHPMITEAKITRIPDQTQAKQSLGLDSTQPVLTLCPGSRQSEVDRHLPLMIDAAQLIQTTKQGDVQIAILVSDTVEVTQHIENTERPIHLFQNDDLHTLFSASDAAILVSGTITLQAAAFCLPNIIIYKTSAINYWLAKQLIKTRYIGLSNIVCQSPIAEELIQDAATPQQMATKCLDLFTNEKAKHTLEEAQKKLHPHCNDDLILWIESQLPEKE